MWKANDAKQNASDFFDRHFRKIIRIRHAREASLGHYRMRYLSKNNANISRLDVLAEMFPDAAVVIPFRNPLAHAASLLRQHKRFITEHSNDRFAKNYMEWLGHYEFGANLRPINFDGWLDGMEMTDQTGLEFWLKYWMAAYSHVLDKRSEQVILVSFDQLLTDGEGLLGRIADRVGIDGRSNFIQGGETLRVPTTQRPDPVDVSSDIISAAQELYLQLEQQAV
jgi:hypothetical protein